MHGAVVDNQMCTYKTDEKQKKKTVKLKIETIYMRRYRCHMNIRYGVRRTFDVLHNCDNNIKRMMNIDIVDLIGSEVQTRTTTNY